ncbi:MAG: hypothetical protein ACK50M_01765 [Cyclobacteriaceae bacterium]|jgi:hypothetical protein
MLIDLDSKIDFEKKHGRRGYSIPRIARVHKSFEGFPISLILILGGWMIQGCVSPAKTLSRGEYDLTVIQCLEKFKRNGNQPKINNIFIDAYQKSINEKLARVEEYERTNDPFKWAKTFSIYQEISDLKRMIERNPEALELVSNPLSKEAEIAKTRLLAADEYYRAGIESMYRNTSQDALRAFNYFQLVNDLAPGYKDVLELQTKLQQTDSFKIVRHRVKNVTDPIVQNSSKSQATIKSFPSFSLGLNNYFSGLPDAKITASWYADVGWLVSIPVNSNRRKRLLIYPNVSWYNFRFEDPNILVKTVNGKTVFVSDSVPNVARSKITSAYIGIKPLYWVTVEGRRFNSEFSLGPYAYVLLDSYLLRSFNDPASMPSVKINDRFNLNSLRYGVYGSVVLGNIGIFVQQDVSVLFQRSRGPSVNPFVVGLAFRKAKYFQKN